MDLIDLLGGPNLEEPHNQAPIELMSQFLMLINDKKMLEALPVADQILEFEPSNQLILRYKVAIDKYILLGLGEEIEEEFETDEESTETDSQDSEESESEEEIENELVSTKK